MTAATKATTASVSVGPAVAGSPRRQTLEEVIALTRRLRLPYLRKAAADVRAHRPGATLGPRRGAAGAARRGGRRPRPSHPAAAPPRRRTSPPARPSTSGTRPRCSIPAPTQHALRTLEWVDRHENLCVCGPSGTGKSHFCEALGQPAIDTGRTVAWFTIEDLGALVRRHRADDSITKAIRRITRADLIIVDDIGMLARRRGRRRRLLPPRRRRLRKTLPRRVSRTCTRPASTRLMPKTLATATVDRLLHHAHVCVTNGTQSCN